MTSIFWRLEGQPPPTVAKQSGMPSISVVTVSYNSARTIADTLLSVAKQVDADYEHLVIDGGSTDPTMDIVRAHAHPRLHALSEGDEGIYDAMNKGLARASGDYVLFLNSDDYLAGPDRLHHVAKAVESANVDCLFADTQFVASDGRTLSRRLYSARGIARWWLAIGAMPPHPSMFLRRKLMQDMGGYDTRYRIAGDFDFVARAILRHQASFAHLPLVTTRFRAGGVSTAGAQAKIALNREVSCSLAALGYRATGARVLLRYPFKLAQYRSRHHSLSTDPDWFNA